MIEYVMGILPLINNLKREIPDATQSWYTDDAGDLDMFVILETYFDFLTLQVLVWMYHANLAKIVLIVCLENLEAGKVFGKRRGFRVCTGARYLGGYIGGNESKSDWLRDRTLTWEKSINTIRKTMGNYPQDSYAEVVHSIQL